MEKDPEAESSSLGCILSGTWTLISLPFWLGAAGLLVVSTTSASRFFAIALICLLPLPLNFLHWHRLSRKITTGLLLVVGLGAFLLCTRQAPDHNDNQESPARVTYENGFGYSRYSVTNLIPEVDQCIFGSYILGAVDPDLSWGQGAEIRTSVREIYADLQNDTDLAPLPCVLGSAYREMIGLKPRTGISFVYVPKRTGWDPLEKKTAIVFLHGGLGNFQAYWARWKSFADKTGVAIVVPTFGAGNWDRDGGLEVIEKARKFCAAHPRIDEGKLVLAGISNGGTGVIRGGMADPGKWRGLLFLSPVLEKSAVESNAFADGWGGRKALIITGASDKRTTADYVRKAVAGMEAINMELETHYLPDKDHFLIYSDWPEVQKLIEEWVKTL